MKIIGHQMEIASLTIAELKQKTKPKKDNDASIGKISFILIIVFVAYIIWTIVDAYAYGASDSDLCTGDEGTLCNFNSTTQLSSQEKWNSSGPIRTLNAEEQRQFEKFLEMGEKAYEKECYKSLGIGNEIAEDILDYMPDDLPKEVCEDRIKEFKNLTRTGRGTLVENQTSTSTGKVTHDTYNDNTNGFSLEYPTDWHIRDSSKGLNVYKGTREFTTDTFDDPKYSVLDTNSFGNIIFDVWKDRDGVEITDNLGRLMIGDESALSFSYSQGDREFMVVALMHNNVGYVFEYGTLKENFDKDFDTMMHFIGTLRLT